MKNKFEILEHPADIGIVAFGTNLLEAFENSAVGLYSIMFDQSGISASETKIIKLSSSSIDFLLVKWLNEILFLFETEEFIGSEIKVFEIHQMDESISLSAEIKGDKFNRQNHVFKIGVKAVTLHQLEITSEENESKIKVFFDI